MFCYVEPQTTKVYVLDHEDQELYNERYPESYFLTIKNLESFYNYRTIGPDYEYFTSVLSNNNVNNMIKLFIPDDQNGTFIPTYSVLKSVDVKEPETNMTTLHLKKNRIIIALNQVEKMNLDDLTVKDFNKNFISSYRREITSNIDEAKELPQTCRRTGTKTKPPCSNCVSELMYSVDLILSDNITLDNILVELKNHGHASTRKIPLGGGRERWRNREESARELADHYIGAHGQEEPFIYKILEV